MLQIDMPVDYHVWDAMLEHYQRHMPKLAKITLELKDHFVDNTE